MTDTTIDEQGQLPNIVLIITDQQRQVQHWPEGLMEKLMPTMKTLQEDGVTFTNCYTAATLCAPSRASFLSGVYPSVNDVTNTPPIPHLNTKITNLLKLAKIKGYNVAYKGKMHLFTPTCVPKQEKEENQDIFTTKDIAFAEKEYSFNQWNPPDDALTTGGNPFIAGGCPNNDERFLNGIQDEPSCMTPGVLNDVSIIDFLNSCNPKQPFFLVCSFGNPHDISIWPELGWGYKDWENDPNTKELLKKIDLPKNFDDGLQEKPSAQYEFVKLTDITDPHCHTYEERVKYCRFYAYLHSVVDKQIDQVLKKLNKANTVIFRFADHGEMAQSHGMIQKGCNSYQETINVPLIVSYKGYPPQKFPYTKGFPPGKTDSFASLIDIVPTIAELMGIDPNDPEPGKQPPLKGKYKINGQSLMPILKAENKKNLKVRDSIIFFTEDLKDYFKKYFNIDNALYEIPICIRSIRTKDDDGDWMYAVYFTKDFKKIEYEMYNLGKGKDKDKDKDEYKEDPGQMTNLAWPKKRDKRIERKIKEKMRHLHNLLTKQLDYYHAKPEGWLLEPVFKKWEN